MVSLQTVPTTLPELVRSISIHVSGSSQFHKFQRLYENDRIAFAYDVFPEYRNTIANYQIEILGYFDDGYTRVSVRGPHGLGKTFIAALITHHSILTVEDDCKVPTTASAWRQLEKYLWPEIRKLSKKIDWTIVGRDPYDQRTEMMQLSIRLTGGVIEAFAVASNDHTTMEGAHAKRLVYIFDEAKTIPRPTWNAAEGAFSTANIGITDIAVDRMEGWSVGADGVYSVKGVVPDGSGSQEVGGKQVGGGQFNGSPDKSGELGQRGGISKGIGQFNAAPRSAPPLSELPAYTKDTKDNLTPSPELTNDHNNTHASVIRSRLVSQHAIDQFRKSQEYLEEYEAMAFAISTPGEPSGQFYDIHMRKPGYEDWKVRHVTLDEAIAAGRVSPQWAIQRERQWGRDSSIFQNRVLGEFADISEEGLIPLSWVRAAVERWKEWSAAGFPHMRGPRTLGVDVARGGEDSTVLAQRDGWAVKNVYKFQKLSTTSTAGFVKRYASGRKINIEMDGGLGASVYDMLKEDGVTMLRPITVSSATYWRDRSKELAFTNVRAAMWWNMKEILDPEFGSEVLLPPIDELVLDLSTPHWEMMRNAIIKLEPKRQINMRLGRSTDFGDAVCLAFWMQSSGGGLVF